MRKFKWHDYLRLNPSIKASFIGVVVDKNNNAMCYEPGEEKKYKAAVTRKKKEEDV